MIGKVTIGGRKYKTTKIGNQEWLAENLDYKFDVNGSQIPIGVSGTPTTPSAWYYNNNETDYGIDGTYKCGLLYNWYAVSYLETNKATLLPSGWHVPTSNELNTLFNFLGTNSGTILKAIDNSITNGFPNNWNGFDICNFRAVPTGCYHQGSFRNLGIYTNFWTSTESGSSAYYYFLSSGNSPSTSIDPKGTASSIRLVKDIT